VAEVSGDRFFRPTDWTEHWVPAAAVAVNPSPAASRRQRDGWHAVQGAAAAAAVEMAARMAQPLTEAHLTDRSLLGPQSTLVFRRRPEDAFLAPPYRATCVDGFVTVLEVRLAAPDGPSTADGAALVTTTEATPGMQSAAGTEAVASAAAGTEAVVTVADATDAADTKEDPLPLPFSDDDIDLVMSQADFNTRPRSLQALHAHHGDIVNAIMALQEDALASAVAAAGGGGGGGGGGGVDHGGGGGVDHAYSVGWSLKERTRCSGHEFLATRFIY
jgi:NACalpha-BTF3-like transcription factor